MLGPVAADTPIEITVVLRRRTALDPDLVTGPGTVTATEFADRFGAAPADVELVVEVLTAAGATVTGIHPGSRRVLASAPASVWTEIFDTELTVARSEGLPEFRSRSGELRIPATLDGIVTAVLGLDDRAQARTRLRMSPNAAAAQSFSPAQVGALYNFPAGTDGTGQTIAVIELGGGYDPADLAQYFTGLGLTAPTVTAVGVDGATNAPSGDPGSADGEVLLDIEVAGALAPGAGQMVYFAPNSDRGFVDAVSTAVHATPPPAAVSISWGQAEDRWTAQARTALDQAFADAAALGVSVCVASGDHGSGDAQPDGGRHADFPASSPHALACGGTRLLGSPPQITAETVWNNPGGGATGGGISSVFPMPDYQATAGVPARADGGTGRGVPDVAGNADPETGYQVLIDGQRRVVGGTSAVAPLWAALIARLAQATGRPLGLVHPHLYRGIRPGVAQPGFRDITSGDNGAYHATAGWDPCTGLGTPDGTALLRTLR
ncbi:peptidase S53 [Nocardia stercoris]|uniref:Peptidase S53 n=1 Tax=Nocardia stercoris TaxID=2483361 RepID=A0A3M2KQQ2_9NOCA|nr:peptidase S53 [Nocardia stercoris]